MFIERLLILLFSVSNKEKGGILIVKWCRFGIFENSELFAQNRYLLMFVQTINVTAHLYKFEIRRKHIVGLFSAIALEH